jgi:uncharacterized protein with von Willebrand factor type A (vWA) domain
MPVDLNNLDIELLLDKSGSMDTADCPGGLSRWKYAEEVAVALARKACKHDKDGIGVTVFAGSFKSYDGVTEAKVAEVFRENEPNGSTDTAAALKSRLDAYFARKSSGGAKNVLLLVLTDGEPTDKLAVADVIVAATKKMDRDEEVAIQFVQVGKDAAAAKFLAFLDDGLTAKGAKFDIVDTVTFDQIESLSFTDLIEKSFAD